ILKNARTRILIADHTKFERSAPVRICDISELDYVVFDRPPPNSFVEKAKACGTRILTKSVTDE
ncbi:MAG: DeoR family transcriptional regulator, partial [Alphaproteobacteria bacterium]